MYITIPVGYLFQLESRHVYYVAKVCLTVGWINISTTLHRNESLPVEMVEYRDPGQAKLIKRYAKSESRYQKIETYKLRHQSPIDKQATSLSYV